MAPERTSFVSTLSNIEAVQSVTRALQAIVGALIGGVVVFLAAAVAIAWGDQAADWDGPMGPPTVTLIAILLGVAGLVLSIVAPSLIVGKGLKRLAQRGPEDLAVQDPWKEGGALPATDVGALLPLFHRQLLIAETLLVGAAFFAILAHMIDGGALPVGLAGVLIAAALVRFPTPSAVNTWIDEQKAKLIRLRADGA